jgi:hypothetical protein
MANTHSQDRRPVMAIYFGKCLFLVSWHGNTLKLFAMSVMAGTDTLGHCGYP